MKIEFRIEITFKEQKQQCKEWNIENEVFQCMENGWLKELKPTLGIQFIIAVSVLCPWI